MRIPAFSVRTLTPSRRARQVLMSFFPVAALAIVPVSAAAQAPTISHLSPPGGQRGSSIDVTVHGSNLAGASVVWTDLPVTATIPAELANNGKEAGKVVLRLVIPPDATVGIGGLRVATPRGMSNLRLFMIDDLQPVAENGQNKSLAQAQKIELPCALAATMEAESWDYYRFSAQSGQRVTAEVVARRLGSKMDPLLRLLDASGRELAYCDDAAGIGQDARLTYVFPQAGDYVLQVQDVKYAGGADFVYRLRLGDFPATSLPFPLGGKRGTTVRVTTVGPGTDHIPPLDVHVPADPAISILPLEMRSPTGGKVESLTFEVGSLDETIETEPNDDDAAAMRFTIPQMLNGRLEKAGDVDRFLFTAKKDERIVFQTVSRSLGSPADLFMTIQNTQGAELASNDDAVPGKVDARIDFKVPADGDYTLSMWDLNGRGGGEFVYRVRATPYEPGFQLLARQLDAQKTSIDKMDVPQGAAAMLLVRPVRQDYSGPIALSVEGLPAGLTASPTVIGAGQGDTVITVHATEAATLGGTAVRVAGTAEINGKKVVEYADCTEILSSALANLPWPPRGLTDRLALSVTEKPFFTLEAKLDAPAIGRGTTLPITVIAKRADDFKDPITLAIQGLPANIDLGNKPIDKDQTQTQITLTSKNNSALGIHSVVVTGTGKRGDQQITVAAAALNLNVRMPIDLALESTDARLAVNGKIKVKAKVSRLLGFKAPVELELKNLPKGVTAAKVTVPEAAEEAEIELAAAADAAIGSVKNLSLVGTVDIGGQKQTVAAPDAPLAIVAAQ